MSTDGDLYGLRAAIDNVVDTANEALQSGVLTGRETEELQVALQAFEISTVALVEISDRAKLNLVSVINSALTIGAICKFSESIVSNVAHHRMRTQAAMARRGRSEKPQEKALNEAITAALNGRFPVGRFTKEACAILGDVNRYLKSDGHDVVKVDVVRRRLEKRAAQNPRS